jgi:hypothetical protein
MANTAKEFISKAKSQLGKSGSKYWKFAGFKHPVSWCGCFMYWCARKTKAGIDPSGPAAAHNWYLWGKKHGRNHSKSEAKPGDIITFDWQPNGIADHVGVLEKKSGGIFYCIEGNTGSPARVRRRARYASQILGVTRPKYATPKKKSKKAKVGKSGIILPKRGYFKKGDGYKGSSVSTDDVKKLQKWLKKNGYYKSSVDGKLGSETVKAVARFQKKNKLEVDGLFGKKSLKKADKLS